jgi:CheY-like chemotaxis protein
MRRCPNCGEHTLEPTAGGGQSRPWRCRRCGAFWTHHPSGFPDVAGRAAAGPLVLIADDYDDMRDLLGEVLDLAGLAVAEARAGDEAVQKAFDLQPDLIVLDLSLPRMDGIDVTQRLKGDARTRHIPIIILTGRAMPADCARIEASGCDRFLRKPCTPEDFVSSVRDLLDLS